ncbi:MAG: hypothetical protein ACK4SA_20805 [Caldilinea sp.]
MQIVLAMAQDRTLATALLPPLCGLLLWWGVGRVERRATVP